MEICRRGSVYNYGERSINFKGARFFVDSKGGVCIEAMKVKDFSGGSHHDYVVTLGSEDLVQIFNALAECACVNPDVVEHALSSSIKSLTQLQYVVSGIARLAAISKK